MSRWTQELVYFVYRSLIKSSEFNQNFSLVRNFFESLESDFDELQDSLAGVIGNCIVTGGAVTAKGGMTVGIGGLFAFAGGKGVSLLPPDQTVPKPSSGTAIVVCVVDSGLETTGIAFGVGDPATPTTPPALTETQAVVFSASVASDQAALVQGDLSYALRIDAANIVEELDSARVSTLLGAFGSLDARLEAIEDKLSKIERLADGMLQVPILANAPTVGAEDRIIYYDSTLGKARFWNGATWFDLY